MKLEPLIGATATFTPYEISRTHPLRSVTVHAHRRCSYTVQHDSDLPDRMIDLGLSAEDRARVLECLNSRKSVTVKVNVTASNPIYAGSCVHEAMEH